MHTGTSYVRPQFWNPSNSQWKFVKYFKDNSDVNEQFLHDNLVHGRVPETISLSFLFSVGMSLVGVPVQGPVEKVSKHARLCAAKKRPEESTKRYPTQCAVEQNPPIPNRKTVTR